MFKLTSDKAAKLPTIDRVRAALIEHVIPVLVENREDFYQGKGQNMTLGQDSFFLTDDQTGEKLGFSWSPNLWAKSDGAGKKAAKDVVETHPLSNTDVAHLDAAIVKFTEALDIPGAVRLATIKARAEDSLKATGQLRVNREDFLIVATLA